MVSVDVQFSRTRELILQYIKDYIYDYTLYPEEIVPALSMSRYYSLGAVQDILDMLKQNPYNDETPLDIVERFKENMCERACKGYYTREIAFMFSTAEDVAVDIIDLILGEFW